MPYRCTSHEEYRRFFLGPPPNCSVHEHSTFLLPPPECMLIDDTCQFSSNVAAIASKFSFFHRLCVACIMPHQLQCMFFTFSSLAMPTILNAFLYSPFSPPVPCSPDVTQSCPSHARCLSLETTGDSFCLDSCYLQNGGCSKNQVCFSEEVDDDNCNSPLSGPCTKTSCMDLTGEGIFM